MMVQHIKFIASMLILIMSLSLHGQEICNNAIDDDGDGLIDLNDEEDCDCPSSIPSGLIPNPSFEDMVCCPTEKEELECAVSWIQASEATSDYLHLCGITVHPNVNKTVPLPIPDGEGYIGFRDGIASYSTSYKEYVGACLNATMEVSKEYRLDFFLGFAPELNQTIDITIYGTTECSNIPFGNGDDLFGCPTNGPGWDQLGQQVVSGKGEWKNIIFDIIADKPYNVIVIGPGCDVNNNSGSSPYFFVDRLALAELADFNIPFADIIGDLCQEGLTIVAEDDDDYGYQWFKDGVALIGETNISLDLAVDVANEGFYEVLITTSDGCFNSEEFELFVPVFETYLEGSICEGETYNIAGNEISATGSYSFPLTSTLGCDSIVFLDLEVLIGGTNFLTPQICEGEVYNYAGQSFTEAGFYSFNTPGQNDCDSLISIDLTVTPKYNLNYPISICQGQTIQEGTDILSTTGNYTFIYYTVAGCDSIVTINLIVNDVYEDLTFATICEGESYQLGSQLLTAAGTYGEVLSSIAGCDSSVLLTLEVENITTAFDNKTICLGENYPLGTDTFNTEGSYLVTLQNVAGCDSLISLNLSVVEWNDGILLPDYVTVNLGDPISISPSYIAPGLIQIVWTDSTGTVLSNEDILNIDQVINIQNITLTGLDQYGCIDMDEIEIRVNRNIGIYTPNIFSPNGDGNNDYFRPKVNQSLAALKEMMIYDRWGNLVYSVKSIADLSMWQGWDGKINGLDAITGVYVYIATYVALDSEEETISGDVTIVR